MAEIRVVEKRGGLAWLWILVVVVVVAFAVWFFVGSRATPAGAPPDAAQPTSGTSRAPGTLPAAPMDSVSSHVVPPDAEMRLVRA